MICSAEGDAGEAHDARKQAVSINEEEGGEARAGGAVGFGSGDVSMGDIEVDAADVDGGACYGRGRGEHVVPGVTHGPDDLWLWL